jgi:hypothetical protein
MRPVEFYYVAAATTEFNAFFETVEKRCHSKHKYNSRNNVSVFPVLDKVVIRIPEDPSRNFGEIFEMAFLIGVCICYQPGYENTAEQ